MDPVYLQLFPEGRAFQVSWHFPMISGIQAQIALSLLNHYSPPEIIIKEVYFILAETNKPFCLLETVSLRLRLVGRSTGELSGQG